mmetsp:Transcript_117970/g.333672  ORF Transcript_117970/g.333672 Transcript_117970/m.333672 type:complete len:741 (-) Transcript_117970:112-2334(-)
MAGHNDAMRDLVLAAGKRLKRPAEEVEPYVETLAENWFDSPRSLLEAKPEELAGLGLPLRFAKHLIDVASGSGRKGREAEAPRQRGRAAETSAEFVKVLPLRDFDGKVQLRPLVLGSSGRNLRFIEEETGAAVSLRGDRFGPMELVISGKSPKILNEATTLVKELLETIYIDIGRKAAGKGEPDESHGRQRPIANGRDKGREKEKGRGKGTRQRENRDGAMVQEVLEVFESEESFGLKGRLIGSKGQNLYNIQDQSRSKIHLRGEGTASDPLFFEISANTTEDLDRAVELSSDLIESIRNIYDEWLESGGDNEGDRKSRNKGKGKGKKSESGQGGEDFNDVLEVFDTDAEFKAKGKLIGAKGRNIFHIEDATGAKVQLVGNGDVGEPMRFEVHADCAEALDRAMEMASDLIEAVRGQYEEWLNKNEPGQPIDPGEHQDDRKGERKGDRKGERKGDRKGDRKGEGKGEGKSERKGDRKRKRGESQQANGQSGQQEEADFTEVLPMFQTDPGFKTKGRLIGARGRNILHIQDETGAKVRVEGDDDKGEPMSFTISATTSEALENAVRMVKDLMESVRTFYEEWLETGKVERQGKGKSKSNGGDMESAQKFVEYLDVFDCPEHESFNLRPRIVGINGRNLMHIQDKTSATLQLVGDEGELMQLQVGAETAEALDEAVDMARDLVDSVHEEYDQWLAEGALGSVRVNDKQRDSRPAKGKGKGKRRAQEDPRGALVAPVKRSRRS